MNAVGFPQFGTQAIDMKTGQWNKAWYLLLQSLYQRTGSSSGLTTDQIAEGSSNLYYTNTRSRNAINATGSLTYNQTTGVISYNAPTSFAWSAISGTPNTATGYGIASIDGVPIGATTPSTAKFSTLSVTGNAGFNNTAPISKPTVTGSKASNAALASLITALASYGLITDSTT